MLVVPMKDHRDRVVGVLQLINKKSDPGAVIRDERSSERHVLGYETEGRGVGAISCRTGSDFYRELAALRGHREPFRGVHQGIRDRDRPARPRDFRSLGAGGDTHL